MRSVFTMLLIVTVALTCTIPALAHDLNPPSWRGKPGTTFALWEFLTPNPTPPADAVNNPCGTPQLQVWPGVGQQWWPIWGYSLGVWPLSGACEIFIPNFPSPNPYKYVWVQITWAAEVPDAVPFVREKNSRKWAQVINEVELGPTGEPLPAGQSWMHTTYLIYLEPNPPSEIVRIDGGVMVDEIVVDTICVPEPSAAIPLATGLIGLLGFIPRRRR